MLRLTTFGGLALSRDGTALTGAAVQRSRLSLLALLATAGPSGFSRDKMLLHLWPESDEERARHALKQAVYSIRRELGDDDVIVGTASLSLNPALITSDAREFELAMTAGDFAVAAALYTGPFLDGVHVKDSAEFERWSAEQRARYAHLWTTAVERLALDCESRSDWRDAAGHWRTLAAAEPLSGRLTGALIRCLAESGDVSAALQQYRIHESILREEVGSTPEPDVAALAESIRTGTWQRSPDKPARGLGIGSGALGVGPGLGLESGPGPSPNPSPAPQPEPDARRRQPRPKPTRLLPFGLAAAVLLIAIPTAAYKRIDPGTRAVLRTLIDRKPVKVNPRQIVVAPFENKTGDTTLNALGEQTADWFARELNDAGFAVVDSRTARIDTKVVEGIPSLLRAHDINIALAEENGSAYVVIGGYYKAGNRIEANVSVIDVATKQTIKSLGPFYGTRDSADAFIKTLLAPTVTFLGQKVDTTAAALTTSYTSPTSLEAFERVSRAWERFFASSRDTATVFAELDSAARIDTTYATPLLMKAYILDAKSKWSGVNEAIRRVRPLVPRMSRLEKAAFDLCEADLRGDAFARLAISKHMRDLSPGSAEIPLLVVVSALYAGRPAEAVAELAKTDPDRGLNLVAPAYWEWAAEAPHEVGEYAAEERAANTGLKRFRNDPGSIYSMVRVLATRNDHDLLAFAERGIPPAKERRDEPSDSAGDRQDLLILAGRELRTHGHAAVADSFFARVAAELKTLPANATLAQLRRQAHAFYETRDYAHAKTAFEAILQRDSLDVESEGRLATSAAHLGDLATAKRIDLHLANLNRSYPMGRALRWRADIAAVAGRSTDAIALLDQAVRQGLRFMDTPIALSVHVDGDLSALRATPAYTAMLQSFADRP